MSSTPAYSWQCLACDHVNEALSAKCASCGCTPYASGQEIQNRRQRHQKAFAQVGSDTTALCGSLSTVLRETLSFLGGASIGGIFCALLFTNRIGKWGHTVNYLVIAVFFLFAALIAKEKFVQKRPIPSQTKVLILSALLGWLVAGSWLAKYF